MQLSLYLLACSAPLSAGCPSDPSCGPGTAPDSGLTASASGITLTYGGLTAGANNDCPAAGATVTSLTINGPQVGGNGFITLCVERPDQFNVAAMLGTITQGAVRVVDVDGDANGCTFDYRGGATTGTAKGTGVCDRGINPAGFALTLDGTAVIERTCGATVDTVELQLSGTVAVDAL